MQNMTEIMFNLMEIAKLAIIEVGGILDVFWMVISEKQ